MPPIHGTAQQGSSVEAQRYTQGRPEYPEALPSWLRDALGLCPQTVAVDPGVSIGRFACLLAHTGAWVVAVEPAGAMHTQLAKTLSQIRALVGSAQSIPLANGFANTLVCVQAFHWFTTMEMLEGIRRVLVTEDRLGLMWDVHDGLLGRVVEITHIITPYEGDTPRFYKGDQHRPFGRTPFGPLRLSAFACERVGPPEQVIVLRFLSVSFIAVLPETEKNAMTAQSRGLVASHPAFKGKEQVTLPYRTETYLVEAR